MKASVLKHRRIFLGPLGVHFDSSKLFWDDGVHLSEAGVNIFLNDLVAVLDSSLGIGS